MACERVESSGSNNVVTLPAVKRGSAAAATETAARVRNQRNKSIEELVSVARKRSPIKQHTKKRAPVAPNSLSPGQQVQAQHILHLVSHPSHPLTQQLLSSHYGLPLPLPAPLVARGGREGKLVPGQLVTGPTTDHLTTLPRANRRDAQVRERREMVSVTRVRQKKQAVMLMDGIA